MNMKLLPLLILIIAASAFGGSMELTSARLYKKQGELVKSLQFYDEALKKNQDDLEAHFERAELLGSIAMDSTKADLQKQLAKDKSDPFKDLLSQVVNGFNEAKKPRKSGDDGLVKKLTKKIDAIKLDYWTKFYFEAVENDSAHIRAKQSGQSDDNAKQYLQIALRKLDMAILIDSGKWNTYGLKAQILGKLHDIVGSTEAWNTALTKIEASDAKEKDTQNYASAVGVIRENLLQNYYNMGQYDKAMAKADEILAKDPKNEFAIQIKAFSMAQMVGDTSLGEEQRKKIKADAIKYLQEARATRKDDPTIVYYIGQFSLQSGDTAEAVKAFTDVLALDEKDETVLFNLGLIYLDGGSYANTEKAKDIFKKMTEFYPDHAPAWINYGVSLIRLGKNAEGKSAVEKGQSLKK